MAKSKSVPPIPANWVDYIKRSARRYVFGQFDAEDAEQTAIVAFIRARARYNPKQGVFQNYARSAIRNALLNARKAEQRNYDIPASPDDGGGDEIPPPAWAAEAEALQAIDASDRNRAVSGWIEGLPSKLTSTFRDLYASDMSQREAAVLAGVSQPRVSQRNRQLLELGGKALVELARD